MTDAVETHDEDYDEYDEFDDADDRGLSGFSVLIIGLVMIGAFISVIWIAYQQGIKAGDNGAGAAPFVSADPEPVKIASDARGASVENREVYDVFDGEDDEAPTVLAQGPEEPVQRTADDTIGAITAGVENAGQEAAQEIEERLAGLAEEDASLLDQSNDANQGASSSGAGSGATPPTRVGASANAAAPSARVSRDALSGTHLVQVGAFRSNSEAQAHWARLQSRIGDYIGELTYHIERADLGDNGVYHRLRIGPFDSAGEAKDYCAGLKTRNQDCLTRANQ